MNYSLAPNKFLTDHEREALLVNLNKYSHPNLIHTTEFRDAVILRTALETGARATEILNIQSTDLDELNHRVFIRGLKKSNDRLIPVSRELFNNLILLTGKNGGSRPFPISYVHFCRIWHFWRPCKKKLHSLRHTFAVRLYKRTRDLKLVKQALGHRAISNTMIYVDFVDQDDLYRILEPTPSPRPKTQPRAY